MVLNCIYTIEHLNNKLINNQPIKVLAGGME